MAGEDEARSRAVLAEMQLRISQGPHAALGLPDTASPEDVRAAFLGLTKQFHPARFGRTSPELQKLATEVFLGIKSAHETLMKIFGGNTRGLPARRTTGAIPQPTATAGTGRTTGSVPRPVVGTSPPANVPVVSRTSTGRTPTGAPANRSGSMPAMSAGGAPQRPVTQAPGVPRTSTPAAGSQASTTAPIARPGSAPASGAHTNNSTVPIARPTTGGLPRSHPDSSHPATIRGVQGATPTARPGSATQPPATSSTTFNVPTTRGVAPTTPSTSFHVPTARGVAPPQPTQPLAKVGADGTFDEQVALQQARALLDARNWTAARVALLALAAKVPQSKQYRALLCYARGREAHVAGRTEDALAEYQRALQLDPDLSVVKSAVVDLQRRR